MKNFYLSFIAFSCCFVCTQRAEPSNLSALEWAIKTTDCVTAKQILQTTTFTTAELSPLIALAQDVLTYRYKELEDYCHHSQKTRTQKFFLIAGSTEILVSAISLFRAMAKESDVHLILSLLFSFSGLNCFHLYEKSRLRDYNLRRENFDDAFDIKQQLLNSSAKN